MQAAESSVNDFVSRALAECAGGKYESFRALWSAKEEPLPREEFEKGWHAAKEIRVRALEKVLFDRGSDAPTQPASAQKPAPETVYALYIEVSLDPEQQVGQKKPERHAVLMVVEEQNEWRLAPAPKQMREWIKKKLQSASANDIAKKEAVETTKPIPPPSPIPVAP